jgi:hypothetical protein
VSYYDDASLVLIPSGVNASKVYSQKPTNGNGDLTFTRASTATRTNESGVIESVASNVPRLDYRNADGTVSTCPRLLLEPQRTNLTLYSEQFNDVTWLKLGGSSVTENTTTSPDGNLTADTLSLTTNASSSVARAITFVSTTTITISVYAKVASGTKDFRLRTDLPTTTQAFTANTSWQRFSMTATPTGNTNVYIINDLAGTAGDLIIWGFQVEVGSYPTTYIPTTTAAVTRLVDAFSRSNIYTNGLISAAGGTWFLELSNNVALTADANVRSLSIGDNSPGTTNAINIINSPIQIRTRISGVVGNTYTTTSSPVVKIAVKWNGATIDYFVNGVKVLTGGLFAITNMNFLDAAGSNTPKLINQSALFPTPLTDAQCIEITTL